MATSYLSTESSEMNDMGHRKQADLVSVTNYEAHGERKGEDENGGSYGNQQTTTTQSEGGPRADRHHLRSMASIWLLFL